MLQSFFLLREIMHVLKSIPNKSSLNSTVENHCRWIKDYLVLHSACTPKLSPRCLLAFLVSNISLSNKWWLQVFLQASCLLRNVLCSSDYAFVIPKEKLKLIKWFACQQPTSFCLSTNYSSCSCFHNELFSTLCSITHKHALKITAVMQCFSPQM